MATGTLTSTTIAARYKSLLKLTGTANDVLAADASAKYVEDGDGNDSVLSLSTTRVGIGNTAPTALLTAGAITTLVTDGTTAVTPEGVNVHITEASKYAMGIKNADASGDGLIIQAGDASDDFALRVEDYDSANDLLVVQGGGAVGIGTASPSNYYSTTLVVDAPDEDGITVVSPTTGTGYLMFADGTSGNARYRGYISYAHASDKLQFATGGSPRMSIDSSGNVGIGMTPAKLLDLQASDNLALRYYNGATFKAGVEVATTIGDMISGAAVDDLAIRSNANMLFSTGGNTERMRIDSSGNVTIAGDLKINNANYALEGYATGRNVLRHTQFRFEPGYTANTNLKTISGGNFNKPSITDAAASDDATSLGKNETEGSWSLNATGVSLTLNLTETVIEILSISVVIMDLNSSSTTRYNVSCSESSGDILFLINATGSQTNLDWTTILDAGDAVQFTITYITSS